MMAPHAANAPANRAGAAQVIVVEIRTLDAMVKAYAGILNQA